MANLKDIETLLNLDGVVIEQAGGHWTKFDVREVFINRSDSAWNSL